jgi:hypothetical protein
MSHPVLLSNSGLSETLVYELAENATRELIDANIPQYLRLRVVYATKKHPI